MRENPTIKAWSEQAQDLMLNIIATLLEKCPTIIENVGECADIIAAIEQLNENQSDEEDEIIPAEIGAYISLKMQQSLELAP